MAQSPLFSDKRPNAVAQAIFGIRDGLLRWANSGWANPAAFLWAFLQSSVVPGPSDTVILPLGLAEPKRAPMLGIWTAVGAMLGGLTAFAIGVFAFDTVALPIMHWLGLSASDLVRAKQLFAEKGWMFIALGSLPVFSSKVIAMAAGAFGYPVWKFLLVSFLIRGVRFITLGFLLRWGGPYVQEWLRKGERRIEEASAAK